MKNDHKKKATLVHVLRPCKEEPVKTRKHLEPCPVCGAKAYVSSDAPDGFFMGYSAGCPRYCIGDGIHGIESYEEHEERGYAVHGCLTKAEAIANWNRRATNGK